MRQKDRREGITRGDIERRFYPVVTRETLYRVHHIGEGGGHKVHLKNSQLLPRKVEY